MGDRREKVLSRWELSDWVDVEDSSRVIELIVGWVDAR